MKQSHGERTKERILKAGLRTWPGVGLKAVAKAAGMTHPAILYHFPQGTLKNAVADYAVKTGHSRVVLQLIASGHEAAEKLSPAERIKHFNAV